MFNRLLDIIISSFYEVLPFVVLDEYEEGVVLRFGKYNRSLGPGFHWRIPLAEHVDADNVKTKVVRLHSQTIELSDGNTVTVTGVARWKITDIKKAICEVEDVEEAVADALTGSIANNMKVGDFEEVQGETFAGDLLVGANIKVEDFGAEIESLELADMATTRAFKFFGGLMG